MLFNIKKDPNTVNSITVNFSSDFNQDTADSSGFGGY